MYSKLIVIYRQRQQFQVIYRSVVSNRIEWNIVVRQFMCLSAFMLQGMKQPVIRPLSKFQKRPNSCHFIPVKRSPPPEFIKSKPLRSGRQVDEAKSTNSHKRLYDRRFHILLPCTQWAYFTRISLGFIKNVGEWDGCSRR